MPIKQPINPSFSTSTNNDSAHAALFEPHERECAPTKNMQPLLTIPHMDTTECPDERTRAPLLNSMKVHMCNFYDELSPCWSCQCELWEGIDDGKSWLWQEHSMLSEGVTKDHAVRDLQVYAEGGVPLKDGIDLFVHALPEPEHRDNGLDDLASS